MDQIGKFNNERTAAVRINSCNETTQRVIQTETNLYGSSICNGFFTPTTVAPTVKAEKCFIDTASIYLPDILMKDMSSHNRSL